MKPITLSPVNLAVARLLEKEGWSCPQIARVLGVPRGNINNMARRKTGLPTSADELAAEVIKATIIHERFKTLADQSRRVAYRAACLAVACELRRTAAELESANAATP